MNSQETFYLICLTKIWISHIKEKNSLKQKYVSPYSKNNFLPFLGINSFLYRNIYSIINKSSIRIK